MNFIALDKNWRFTYVNINDKHSYQAEPGRVIWEQCSDLVGSSFHSACLKAMDDQEFVYIEIYDPAEESWWANYIYPSTDGLVIYYKDITKQKKADRQWQFNRSAFLEDIKNIVNKAEKRMGVDKEKKPGQVSRKIKLTNNEHAKISLPILEGLIFIKILDILYCKAAGNYTELFLRDGKKYLVSRKLKEYEELLLEHNFFRIHHSTLVHLEYIQNYIRGDGGYVVMIDNTTLDVSRRKKDSFLKRLGYQPNHKPILDSPAESPK